MEGGEEEQRERKVLARVLEKGTERVVMKDVNVE